MKNIIGYLKSFFSLKSSIIGSLALVVAFFSVFGVLEGLSYEVKINDNGNVITANVYSKTVEDALKEAGIEVSEYDKLSLDKTSDLKISKSIDIIRAKLVNLSVNGKEFEVYTTLSTVGEMLDEKKITIDENSLLVASRDALITDGMNVDIIPKVYEELKETEIIPFETVKKANYNMEKGNTRVSKNGVDGEKEVTYKVIKHKGEIVEKQAVSEKVTKNPVSKVIEYGTIAAIQTSRGDDLRYKKVLTCSASAYCLKGRTATGRYTSRGVVAVDPRVIPLGSKLYIESADGRFVYGYAVAADTGGAIKGNKVDLYMETKNECLSFGRRNVKVYILE